MSGVQLADGISPQAVLNRFGRAEPYGGYADGRWAASPHDLAMFSRHMLFSVLADSSGIARYARTKDVEARTRVGGDAGPEDAPLFLLERADFGHNDGGVYCSLLTVPAVVLACEREQVHVNRWHLAWYWGHGEPRSVQPVLDELFRLTQIALDPKTVWAWQWVNYQDYDLSKVFGPADFAR